MNTFAEAAQLDDPIPPGGQDRCLKPFTCPLDRVKAGVAVRIKAFSAPPDVTQRLREIGFVEQQVIRLLVRQSNLICLVCNARLALSLRVAQMIIVEPLPV